MLLEMFYFWNPDNCLCRAMREKRKYEKKQDCYWNEGIVQSRKKRQRSQVTFVEPSDQEPGPSSAALDHNEEDLNKLSVAQLHKRIRTKKIQVKGLAKFKKCELIEVLKKA